MTSCETSNIQLIKMHEIKTGFIDDKYTWLLCISVILVLLIY